ncbi:hypothetical protein C1H46_045690 [Malus baccata]|uniref:Pentacotripeptide-repeat region of PRORP domain-containing protein n=1 Tax=Malus baccata TaxID=106549 RepID=A0A540K3F2_MALBA|nr:hypothetical protein C1H46_045690 [Malus baccata]
MREMGWVPSVVTFSSVITACVKQWNMVEAIRIKDGMVSCGYPVNLVAATSLMKGYCVQGNLESALGLFSIIIEDGLTTDRVTYAILIEYCSKNGNMEKAYELYTQMKDMDIFPDVYIVNYLIRGFLKYWSFQSVSNFLNEAVECGVANVFSYNNILSWLFGKGKVSEACSLWDKMMCKGVVPNKWQDTWLLQNREYGACTQCICGDA